MSNYTEADVEQARVRVRALIRGQVVSLNEQASLETLIAAALDGTKVPGLVAWQHAVLEVLATGLANQPTVDNAPVIIRGMVAKLREFDQRDAEVSALQARVAELEAKVTQAHAEWDAATDRATEAEAERDALRAQVDAVPTLVRKTLHHHGLSASLCNESADVVRRALSALSALSAETKGVKS